MRADSPMLTTTLHDENATLTPSGTPQEHPANQLVERYERILQEKRLNWTTHNHLSRLLGRGGQGVVYLTERRGADNFTIPVAVKIFSPDRYLDARTYDEAMFRIAHVASLVAQIQHDNLLDVHNFVDRDRIRIMVMEWVDGYDLCQLLVPEMLDRIRSRVCNRRWEYINSVIVTAGTTQPRI
jgi:hypothetical protein